MDTLEITGNPRKIYTITQGGISITTFANSKLPTEEHVPFENIKNDRFFYIQKSSLLLISSGVCTLIYFLILADSLKNHTNYHIINHIWGVLALTFLLSYFLLRPKVFFLKTNTGKFIKFRISKNENEVALFVKIVIEKRNSFLKLRYGLPNSYISYDAQFSNFNILLNEGIITMEEYQNNIDALSKIFEQTMPKQTFTNYSQN